MNSVTFFILLIFFSFKAFALEVAVVGAGASGLTADGTTIELGGLVVPSGFKTINSLIRLYGPRPQVFPSKVLFLNKNNRWQKFKGYSALGPVGTLLQMKRLLKMYRRFPELNTPHLVPSIHPDLFLTSEVIPAYYALKLFKTIVPVGVHGYLDNINPFSSPHIKGLRSFKNGYSELWENMAAQFDVRLSEEVTSIAEGEVTTTKGSYQFDKVVVSVDIPTARSIVMEPSRELIKFSENLSSHRFLVSVIKTHDLPRKNKHSFFFYPNMNASKTNHIQSLVNFWNNDELYVAYQNLDEGISWDEAKEVVKRVEWDYFHHLLAHGLTPEILEALKKLQGQDGIYFVGESLHFESTEAAAQNARWVVKKYFGEGKRRAR